MVSVYSSIASDYPYSKVAVHKIYHTIITAITTITTTTILLPGLELNCSSWERDASLLAPEQVGRNATLWVLNSLLLLDLSKLITDLILPHLRQFGSHWECKKKTHAIFLRIKKECDLFFFNSQNLGHSPFPGELRGTRLHPNYILEFEEFFLFAIFIEWQCIITLHISFKCAPLNICIYNHFI